MNKLKTAALILIAVLMAGLSGCSQPMLDQLEVDKIENHVLTFDQFVKDNNLVESNGEYFFQEDMVVTKEDIQNMVDEYNCLSYEAKGNIMVWQERVWDAASWSWKWVDTSKYRKWSGGDQLNISYTFKDNMGITSLTDAQVRQAFREATSVWMKVAKIVFYEKSSGGDISVQNVSDSGKAGAAAWASYPYSSDQKVVLNRYTSGSYSYNSIRSIFIHELGHSLGLVHEHQRKESTNDYGQGDKGKPYGAYDPDSIMHYGSSYKNRLSEGDKATIAHLYGNAVCDYENGDFDGDGKTDVVRIVRSADAMTADVHLSNGSSFSTTEWATRQGGMWYEQKWFTGDFNGDGKTDIMKIFNDNGAMSAGVHLSTGNGFLWQRWATKQGGYQDSQRWFTGDFNGDGKTDIMKIFNDNGAMDADVHISTGTSFVMQRWATKQGGFWDSQRWMTGDFNGDGKTDLVNIFNDNGAMSADVHLSTGRSFGIKRWATRQGGFWDSQKWITGDFNGDGKTDLLNMFNDKGAWTADAHLSTGSAFGIKRWATRQGGYWDSQRWFTGDFNNDGKTDMVNVFNDNGAMSADMHLSTGSAFSIKRWATRQGGFWETQKWSVGDYNGDGKSDLNNLWQGEGTTYSDIHLSTGSSFGIKRWMTRH